MGGAVVGAGVGGFVDGGAAVVGTGAVVAAGALVTGATVLVRIDTVELGEMDGSADSDALGLDEVAGETEAERAKKRMPITRTVTRLPATAARPRSTQRGPARRGGGMILVVSPGMAVHAATCMPARRRALGRPASSADLPSGPIDPSIAGPTLRTCDAPPSGRTRARSRSS